VYQAELLLMLEDLNDNSNDPNGSRDQLGELTLLDDLNNAGFATRWDSANPPHYTTNNAQTPPTGNSSWWRRVLGTGTPGVGGPQGVTSSDIGYRIDDNTTGGYFVDMYVSWAALGNPSSLCMIWSTDNQDPNIDQAPNCDSPPQVSCISLCIPPQADFHASNNTTCVNGTIIFTDDSTGSPTSWNWTFGDGGTSTAQNATHSYASAGTYNVTLTVSNACGNDTETKTNYITVSGVAPVAAFNATPTSGCAPLTVNFTDQSTGNPSSWTWTFPGGNPSGANTTGPHTVTYNSTGTYNVTLTVTNTCGSNTTIKTNYITVGGGAPVAAFNATPTSGCAPLTVNFTDQSTGNPSSWSWIFGDGDTSTDQSPSHQYTNAGTYNVTLTVTNNCGNNTLTITDYVTAEDCRVPILTIKKTASPDPVLPGGTLTYAITVTNSGSANATEVTVVDDYDETILTITDPDGGDDDGHTITWNETNPASWDGTIPGGDSVSFTVIAEVASPLSDGIEVVNSVFVTCTEGAQANKQISTVVQASSPVGGDAYHVNKVGLIAPWIALTLTIIGGSIFLARRRYHILE
jgi:uncharacterized repeat protein (TIGR01451 family)